MRIACLQFAPQVGDVNNNLNRADAVLSRANPKDLDLLVLPELAFSGGFLQANSRMCCTVLGLGGLKTHWLPTLHSWSGIKMDQPMLVLATQGSLHEMEQIPLHEQELIAVGYNFRSLQHISPYLEPTAAGITSLWARTTALKHNCIVTAGYPEKVDVSPKWPAGPEYYNSAITVNAEGETVANYRKSHLYYTDETWALEGPTGFYGGFIEGLGDVAMGICMDINPYKFEASWNAWEFAYHVLYMEANLVIVSMAWLTREDERSYSRTPKEPDMETLSYWLARMEPLIRAETEDEIIVVFANRCGTEEDAVYAGSSAVLGIHEGEVKVYGILGRGEKELLVVDTSKPPQAKLVSERKSLASFASIASTTTSTSDLSAETAITVPDIDDNLPVPPPTNPYEEIAPISPSNPRFPQAFFDPKKDESNKEARKSLRSSIGISSESGIETPSPYSSAFHRPHSPKSRNASRTGQREEILPNLDLPSKGSPPPQPVVETSPLQTPPHTAPPCLNVTVTTRNFGRKDQYVSVRPKSSVW